MPRGKTLTNELLTSQKGDILKVGFLRKKGHVRRNWLDRWFVLTTEGLYYYKNRTDPKPIGVIPLFQCNVKEDSQQKHKNVLTCWTAEGKDYPIQASTRDEMLVWIKAISDATTSRNQRPRESTSSESVNPASKQESSSPQHSSPTKERGAVGGGSTSKDHDTDDDSEEDDDDDD